MTSTHPLCVLTTERVCNCNLVVVPSYPPRVRLLKYSLAPEGDCLLREVASLYVLLTERGINWRESELQLFLVHSRSLHRMQHYLTPSVIYVMNWELEFLLVLDKSSVCTGCNTAFIVTCW